MNRYRLAGALAIGTATSLAIFAGPAAAWDDKPCGATEATAHLCAPGEVARNGTIPVPLPPPPPALLPSIAPVGPVATTPGSPDTHQPAAAVPAGVAPVKRAQRPKPTCAELHKVGAGIRWLARFRCSVPLRRVAGARRWAVTGEVSRRPLGSHPHRRRALILSQGPAPATIVAGLLVQVPALAGDVPFASSIQQTARGRTSSGATSAKERGRLVPLGIPGHPWTSHSTGPHRGVSASVSWRSGRLTVSVLYSASRGSSTTSVSVR